MTGYVDNLTTSMENSRNCLRRIARHDETEFSNQSILNAMERFVKSVNIMDETILVPCRLMDLKVGDDQDITEQSKRQGASKAKHGVKDILSSADLFDLFNMLNTVKVDLLWGQNSQGSEASTMTPIATTTSSSNNLNVNSGSSAKGHVRRPSTVSMTSTNSVASVISDSESEAGGENDSGIEAEDPLSVENRDPTQLVAQNFRRHLNGLYRSLQQLTDAANYLTTRYQHDVGSPV